MVALRGVTVRFGEVRALDAASWEVPGCRVTGIVGRNGAGKSTAIQLMAGLLQPDAGAVTVLGRSFPDSAEWIRQQTGYLLAEPALFSYLTPRETLRFLAESYGVRPDDAARRAEDLIELFELSAAADRLVGGFSTGMQKRLAIAAALIHAPRLLVLDEPFESLDPLMVRTLKRLLSAYTAGGGTALISSHLIDVVEEICDHVIIVEAGRCIFEGTMAAAQLTAAHRGAGALEDLYASLVAPAAHVLPPWLSPNGGARRGVA